MARKIYGEWGDVTYSALHEEDGQLYNTEIMPGENVEQILDHCREVQAAGKAPRTKYGMYVGTIPITLWQRWRWEWRNTKRKDGVSWKRFLAAKLNSSDYSRLRFGKL